MTRQAQEACCVYFVGSSMTSDEPKQEAAGGIRQFFLCVQ